MNTDVQLDYFAPITGYLLVILTIGVIARLRRRDESLSDFYLAGKGLGTFVLLLTLYATQYSGNTLLGYPGEAFRVGFAWIMSVGFMMSIVIVYLSFAPKLQASAQVNNFITPGDWVTYRYKKPALTLVINLLLILAISNFLLAQLVAIGHVVSGLTGNSIPFWVGVVFFSLIIIIYETLGGMRAVAWTDCAQGLILLVGLLGLLVLTLGGPVRLSDITSWIIQNQPEKAAVPSWAVCRTWASTILLVGFSGAVYPQAIQRIYAARNSRSLKRSLSFMVFMPFVSTFVVFLIGIIGIYQFSDLTQLDSDQVLPLLLRDWVSQSAVMHILAMFVVIGILAAIMSTADSVLLSLSSMLAKDFVAKDWLTGSPEKNITQIGKYISWAIMSVLAVIAIDPPATLWRITELKMELLSQVAPTFVLGTTQLRLSGKDMLTGVVAGTILSVGLTLLGYDKVWGLHAGLLGLLLNFCLVIMFSMSKSRG